MIVELFGSDGWSRPENDGRIIIQVADGRRFKIEEVNGSLALESCDGEILIHPMSRTRLGIENPTS